MAQDNHMVIKGRKVWRTTAESPLDEKGGVDNAAAPKDPRTSPEAVKKPVAGGGPQLPNDAASGIEVTEFAETLPTEIYSALFKPRTAG
jgi:hypothetical protein